MTRIPRLERGFPLLAAAGYKKTSEATGRPGTPGTYNCIAWAAEETWHGFWWPEPGGYWPFWIRKPNPTVECFVTTFRSLGYVMCDNSKVERFYDKVALYAIHESKNPQSLPRSPRDFAKWEPTHMARQLANGSWTSKCGKDEDIEHRTCWGLNSYGIRNGAINEYGCAVLYMKRLRIVSVFVRSMQRIQWKIEAYLRTGRLPRFIRNLPKRYPFFCFTVSSGGVVRPF